MESENRTLVQFVGVHLAGACMPEHDTLLSASGVTVSKVI
jgi:hypothetical protein